MPSIKNLVHQTSSSTGTGNLTLATVNGKQSFATAFGTGAPTDVFYYFISSRNAAEWEFGTGHMSDATTLVRDTIIGSSNSNSAVDFSTGTLDVVNDLPAEKQVNADDLADVATSGAYADLSGTPDVSGTNTGDQTITLTGDVTGSGTGSFAATIASGAVTLAKMANMATASLIYRKTAGSGAPEVNSLATLKTDLGLSGTNSGDQTTVTGNAGTATALATARNIDGQAFDGTANITVIAPGTHAATSKTTPVDADELAIVDSAASNVLKKLTWANLKATLKTYLDTLYQPVAGLLTSLAGLTIVAGDIIYGSDSGTLSKLGKGSNGQVLTLASGLPSWADAAGGLTGASQSDQEAGSSSGVAVTPAVQQFHASAAKAWARFSGGTSPTIAASYNITSVTHNGTGDSTATINVDFSGANWAATVSHFTSGSVVWIIRVSAMAAGSIEFITATTTGTQTDPNNYMFAGFGDQ